MAYTFKKPKTIKSRIYQKARARGDSPKAARKVARDLDEAIVMAHRDLVEIDKEVLIGALTGEIIGKNFAHIRRETGMATSTISRLVKGQTSRPTMNTISSLGRFLDMEISAKPRSRTAKVIPFRKGGKTLGSKR